MPTQTAESLQTSTTAAATAIVTASEALNVRTGPAMTYPVAGWLAAGSQVEVVSKCVRGWVEISHQNLRGWVNASYLDYGYICR